MNEHVYNSMIRDNAVLRSEVAKLERQLEDAMAKIKRLEKANTVRRDEVLIKTGLKKRLSNLLKRQV